MYCVSCDLSHDEAIETSLIDFFGTGGTMIGEAEVDLNAFGDELARHLSKFG
jgi:hypothetical protein